MSLVFVLVAVALLGLAIIVASRTAEDEAQQDRPRRQRDRIEYLAPGSLSGREVLYAQHDGKGRLVDPDEDDEPW